MPKPCFFQHPAEVAGCPVCKLYHGDPVYRDLWDAMPVRGAEESPPRPAPACRFEGPVLEAAGCACEMRHVRHCLNDAMDWARCTRGRNNNFDPDVRACCECPGFTADKDEDGGAG